MLEPSIEIAKNPQEQENFSSMEITSDNFNWREKITKDFAISNDLLKTIVTPGKIQNFYKKLHESLSSLKSNYSIMPGYLKNIYNDKKDLLISLNKILNNPNTILKSPQDEFHPLLLLSIYAKNIDVPILVFKEIKTKRPVIFYDAIIANNIELLDEIIEFARKSPKEWRESTFNEMVTMKDCSPLSARKAVRKAAKVGNLKVVSFLLDPSNELNLKIDETIYGEAAKSGNAELLRFLKMPANEKTKNSGIFSYAGLSGNVEMVKYLLDLFSIKSDIPNKSEIESRSKKIINNNKVKAFNSENEEVHMSGDFKKGIIELHIMSQTDAPLFYAIFGCAIQSGSVELVKFLISNFTFLKPKKFDLNTAASYGHFELVCYLLDSENGFGLSVDLAIVNSAAQSGNLKLVRYLIEKGNLKPDEVTVRNAFMSGNVELLDFILTFNPVITENKFHFLNHSATVELIQRLFHPNNKFGLKPSSSLLVNAAHKGLYDIVIYLLDPKNNFGLKPDNYVLTQAFYSNNIKLLRHLLDPKNNFGLTCHNDMLGYNKSICSLLIGSQISLQKSFEIIKSDSFKWLGSMTFHLQPYVAQNIAPDSYLQSAYNSCPDHFDLVIKDAIASPSKYGLENNAIFYLTTKMKEIQNKNTHQLEEKNINCNETKANP